MNEEKNIIDYRCGNCNNTVYMSKDNVKPTTNSKFIIAKKICDYCGQLVSFKVYKSK